MVRDARWFLKHVKATSCDCSTLVVFSYHGFLHIFSFLPITPAPTPYPTDPPSTPSSFLKKEIPWLPAGLLCFKQAHCFSTTLWTHNQNRTGSQKMWFCNVCCQNGWIWWAHFCQKLKNMLSLFFYCCRGPFSLKYFVLLCFLLSIHLFLFFPSLCWLSLISAHKQARAITALHIRMNLFTRFGCRLFLVLFFVW